MQRLPQVLQSQLLQPALITLLATLADGCRDIARQISRGAVAGVLGNAGAENVQGEAQKKLDVIANDILKALLLAEPSVRALASEEETEIVAANPDGRFLVAFDPLDGSSNIDINGSVGTIFSIFEAPGATPVTEADFLRPGRQQIAAGYVLYGPSVMLALTAGQGVQFYTLDPVSNEFLLTSERVAIPAQTQEFAINMSNQRFWAEPMRRYIADLLLGKDGPRKKNFNMRWVAAMVSDVHRILCRGGIFSYPWDRREPDKPGKLRLMYEANPMALLIERAGGEAWTDAAKILDLQPEHIHQRVPVILGSAEEVLHCISYHTGR
ncbi:MAG: class 1 fructose-bisphosphatase [Spongiibacteraceae bacterium]|jgi:fructose-1,6-bisphosphatase I|nr:class 1 fructose-bisphosphatase [Spongiibacteraceae bacterium]